MTTNIIGIKELQLNLKRVADDVKKGKSFTVVRDSRPAFRIEPITERTGTLEDFLSKITFKGGDPDMSQKVDEILYGGKIH